MLPNAHSKPIKLLHTSDWHIGRSLYGQHRYQEFEAFLDWMIDTLKQEAVDLLLIAGDIFDTTTPSNRAQNLYYRFLHQATQTPCRHIIITAGNHDSPSFLEAPKALLNQLNVQVIGQMSDELAEEVILLNNPQGEPELLVCAVPYLRDKDIRQVDVGEDTADKARKQIAGIRDHYAQVVQLAEEKREQLGRAIPIVATGHLFTAGGQTSDGDGVRDLYVGSLAYVTAEVFPSAIDYLALGHLHRPQLVNQCETMRYSGSPLAMSFGEAKEQKSLCLVTLEPQKDARPIVSVELLKIPTFQPLERLTGDLPYLLAGIAELAKQASSAWLELIYTGDELIADLREPLEASVAKTQLTLVRIKNNRILAHYATQSTPNASLDDLSLIEVFNHCLTANAIPEAQQAELRDTYQEVINALNEAETAE